MAEVSIQKNGALKFDFVAPHLYEILCGIREAAETPDPRVEARFFPEPSEGDDSLAEDWKAFVQPDLHEGFQSARETVAADLRGAKERKTGHFTFTIPKAHIDAWLSALNQARLALAEWLGRQGRSAEAIEELRRALEQRPDFVEARRALGEVLLRAGAPDDVARAYRELLDAVVRPMRSFQCRQCGYETAELQWKCPQCQRWDTIAHKRFRRERRRRLRVA